MQMHRMLPAIHLRWFKRLTVAAVEAMVAVEVMAAEAVSDGVAVGVVEEDPMLST